MLFLNYLFLLGHLIKNYVIVYVNLTKVKHSHIELIVIKIYRDKKHLYGMLNLFSIVITLIDQIADILAYKDTS